MTYLYTVGDIILCPAVISHALSKADIRTKLIDPAALEEKYNRYPLLTLMTEIVARRSFEMSDTELTNLEATKEEYRKMIEKAVNIGQRIKR